MGQEAKQRDGQNQRRDRGADPHRYGDPKIQDGARFVLRPWLFVVHAPVYAWSILNWLNSQETVDLVGNRTAVRATTSPNRAKRHGIARVRMAACDHTAKS